MMLVKEQALSCTISEYKYQSDYEKGRQAILCDIDKSDMPWNDEDTCRYNILY